MTVRRLDEASALLKSQNFIEALACLEDIDPIALDNELFVRYAILYGELLIRTGQPSFEGIERAIELLRATSKHSLFGKAKLVRGWQLQVEGDFESAKECLLEAYSGALRARDNSLAASVLNRLALGNYAVGEYDMALQELGGGERILFEGRYVRQRSSYFCECCVYARRVRLSA